MNLSVGPVHHDLQGYKTLVDLAAKTRGLAFKEIVLDMSGTSWFDADMCAILGAILYKTGREANTVVLADVPAKVEQTLSRNGFLCHYGRRHLPDGYGTTVPYQRFEIKDERYFAKYIEDELVSRTEIPRMSTRLLKRFRESIFEIFSNAVIHSRTRLGIYSCGQYYPRKHLLFFAVADLGVGILHNVRAKVGLGLTATQAIDWAMHGANTTKDGPIPGGHGLKLLYEFIKLNKGRIQIVSDTGYWELAEGIEHKTDLPFPFPGTVVNIMINTADRQSYVLREELSEADIF